VPQSISAPDRSQPVTLRVTAPNPSAEIFVIDHRLLLVDRGAGELVTRQLPGVYKIKVQSGRDTQEKTVLLLEDETVTWGRQPVDSAAPLSSSGATHEYHMAGANVRSRQIDVTRGTGGRLFVMVRRWSSDLLRVSNSDGHPAAGLRISALDGAWSEDLARLPVEDGNRDAWCAISLSVDPGAYLLQSLQSSGAILEQAVTVSRDWQTQVFLLERALPVRAAEGLDLPAEREGALLNTTILMSEDGFDADDQQFQLTESARLALADDRPVLNQQLDAILRGKFDNPMLGIMGAHLLLLALEDQRNRDAEQMRRQRLESSGSHLPRQHRPWDQALFDVVVGRLQGLVGGDHPDVQALSLRASGSSGVTTRVSVPPMLRRSWSLLVAASNERPDLVPIELWQRTAMRTAAAPFLCWVAPTQDRSVADAFVEDLKAQIGASRRASGNRRTRSARAAGRVMRETRPRDPAQISADLDIPRAAVEWLIESR
jgi:hypothetical protein